MEDQDQANLTGKILTIRLKRNEWLQVSTDAKRAGMTVSAYVRSVLLDAPVPRAIHRVPANENKADLKALLAQIGKIGSNLNQLTKAVNSGIIPYALDLQAAMNALEKVSNTILAALGRRPS